MKATLEEPSNSSSTYTAASYGASAGATHNVYVSTNSVPHTSTGSDYYGPASSTTATAAALHQHNQHHANANDNANSMNFVQQVKAWDEEILEQNLKIIASEIQRRRATSAAYAINTMPTHNAPTTAYLNNSVNHLRPSAGAGMGMNKHVQTQHAVTLPLSTVYPPGDDNVAAATTDVNSHPMYPASSQQMTAARETTTIAADHRNDMDVESYGSNVLDALDSRQHTHQHTGSSAGGGVLSVSAQHGHLLVSNIGGSSSAACSSANNRAYNNNAAPLTTAMATQKMRSSNVDPSLLLPKPFGGKPKRKPLAPGLTASVRTMVALCLLGFHPYHLFLNCIIDFISHDCLLVGLIRSSFFCSLASLVVCMNIIITTRIESVVL